MRVLFIFILLFCSSCSSKVNVSCEKGIEYVIFAKNDINLQIEEVYVERSIENYVDIFLIYTKYQNSIPIGYSSVLNSNVSLLKSEVLDNVVYYYVDNYIFLSDINSIDIVINNTLMHYGYKRGHILFNNSYII